MQLSPCTTGPIAVGASAAAAAHQSALPVAALGAVLLVLAAAAVSPTVCSRKPARRHTAAAVLDRLLATRPRRNSNTKADKSRSATSHSGAREHTGQGQLRPRKLLRHAPWRQNIALLAWLTAVAILLLGLGWGIDQYRQNIMINVGADLVGAIVTIFVITPIVNRAAEDRVREHPGLDYGRYVDRVAGATSVVRIMDTYSNLLDGPHTADFFRAAEQALERQAVVQILLLNPDSLAATQYAHELDDPDAYREIMRNLRVLYNFRNAVRPVSLNRNLSVRIYTTSPPLTVYSWDDKALVSFFQVGKISSQSVQLEVTVGSPLGEFVNERFNSLWIASKSLEEFMRLPVTLTDADVTDRPFEVEFVQLNGRLYVNDSRIVAQMARCRTEATLVYSHHDQQVLNELTIVDYTQPKLHATLSDQFQEKYGHSNDIFISLEPVSNEI